MRLLCILSAGLLSACATVSPLISKPSSPLAHKTTSSSASEQPGAPAVSASSSAQPSVPLAQLFKDSDEASLRLNPLEALSRGDLRYADQFGDYLSSAYIEAARRQVRADAAGLKQIQREALSPQEQVSYDVFAWQTQNAQAFADLGLDLYTQKLPIDHFNAIHIAFADISSGQSIAPFKTLEDYENNLKRIKQFVAFLDMAQVRMREGMAAGIVQPKLVMRNVVDQLDTQFKAGVDGSPFLLPTKTFPASIVPADQQRLAATYRVAIQSEILPAYQRLRDFIAHDYLPRCRESIGLSALPKGDVFYRYLAEKQTTTRMTPDEIHQLGLREVARIRAEMEKVKTAVGFKGDLKAFFNFLRSDPQFKVSSKAALIEAYQKIWLKLQPALPRVFATMPKTGFEIRPVPDYLEQNQAGAYYNQGTPDGTRPGVFYVNTYDLASRTTPGMETLFLHEAIPGHHFQISLAQENTTLPSFQRFGGNTAYVEGWALYAESLGAELGLFTDPYQLFGHLDDEMLRAMRLVVDTGIHTKGWTRARAIQYFLDNSSQSMTDSKNEVERYIAIPAQALAYKVGQITLRRLRTQAETQLGASFDVRRFHDQVLNSGALPMAVLEAKIDRWIEAEKARKPQ